MSRLPAKGRIALLDWVKAAAIVNMVLYHALYDAAFLFGASGVQEFMRSAFAHWWERGICGAFILVSGALVGISALVPIVGALVGTVVGAFMIMMVDPILAVWFVVFLLVLQQIEGNLIYPRVVGSSVGLPPVWVLVAVTVGGSLYGVAGMLFGVPTASVAYTLVKEAAARRLAAQAAGNVPAGGTLPQSAQPGAPGAKEEKPVPQPAAKRARQPKKSSTGPQEGR